MCVHECVCMSVCIHAYVSVRVCACMHVDAYIACKITRRMLGIVGLA